MFLHTCHIYHIPSYIDLLTCLRVGQRVLPEDPGWLFSYIPISVVVVTVTGCSVIGVTVWTSSVVVDGSQFSDP